MASPAITDYGTAVAGTSTSLNVPLPTPSGGILAGDVVIMLVQHVGAVGTTSGDMPNAVSGWTVIDSVTYSTSSGGVVGGAKLYAKRMSGGETGNITVTQPGGTGTNYCFHGATYLLRQGDNTVIPGSTDTDWVEDADVLGSDNINTSLTFPNAFNTERARTSFCFTARDISTAPGVIVGTFGTYTRDGIGAQGTTTGSDSCLSVDYVSDLTIIGGGSAGSSDVNPFAAFHVIAKGVVTPASGNYFAAPQTLGQPSNEPDPTNGVDIATGAGLWNTPAWTQIMGLGHPYKIGAVGIAFQVEGTPQTDDVVEEYLVELGTGGSGSETLVAQAPYSCRRDTGVGYILDAYVWFPMPMEIAAFTRAVMRARVSSATSRNVFSMKLWYKELAGFILTNISIDAGITLTPVIVDMPMKSLSVTLTNTPVIARKSILAKLLAVTVTFTAAATLRMTRLRALSAGLTLAPVISKVKLLTQPVTMTVTAAITNRITRLISLPITVTLTAAITRRLTRIQSLSANLTLTPAITNKWTGYRLIAAGLTLGPTMNRKLFKPVAAGLTLTPVLAAAKSKFLTIPATVTMTNVLTRMPLKSMNVSLTLQAVLNRRVNQVLNATMTANPVIIKKGIFGKALAVGLTLSPNMTVRKTSFQLLAATVTHTAQVTIIRILHLQLNGNLTMNPVMNRRINKTLNDALTLAGNMTVDRLTGFRNISIDATVNMTAALVKVTLSYKLISAAVTLQAALTRLKVAPRLLAAPVTLQPALNRRLNRPLAATTTLTPGISLFKAKFMTIAANISITANLVRLKIAPRTLAANLTMNPAVKRFYVRTLATGVTLTPVIVKKPLKALARTVTMVPVVFKSSPGIFFNLDVVMTMTGKIDKAVRKTMGVTLQMKPQLQFYRWVTRFRDWLLSTKIDEPVLDSAEIDEPELLAATAVSED